MNLLYFISLIFYEFSIIFCKVIWNGNSNLKFIFNGTKCSENFCFGKVFVKLDNMNFYPVKVMDFDLNSRKAIATLCENLNFDSLYSFGMDCKYKSFFNFYQIN